MIKHVMIVNPAEEDQAVVVSSDLPVEDDLEGNWVEMQVKIWTSDSESVSISMDLNNKSQQEGALKVLADMINALQETRETLVKLGIPSEEEKE